MIELPVWERTYFQPGGGAAHLFYKVHGDFDVKLAISPAEHRTLGVPEGMSLQLHSTDTSAAMRFGMDGALARTLDELGPELSAAVEAAPRCAILRGIVDDPPTLDYLRDAVGVVQALFEAGGIAVFDPFQMRWWTAAQWKARVFDPGEAVPHQHAVILFSDDADGYRWYHTRGMLKFGRPDVSVRGVSPDMHDGVVELCNRFIEAQAMGAIVPEGQVIRMPGLPAWTCHTMGDLEDPDFNNRRIEIG
jgi:hypothetical protein